MLNNFIGGGQVFLHKVRMFSQVFFRTLHVSLLIGCLLSVLSHWGRIQSLDWDAVISYRKAAARSVIPAMYNVGFMCQNGEGGEVDIKKAVFY